MRIIIDVGHPGHVHLFKNFARQFEVQGNNVLFTCRSKEFVEELLDVNNLKYISVGKSYKSIIGKVFGLIRFTFSLLLVSSRFKPDLFLSHGSIYAAVVSSILKKIHISFEDTFNFEQIRLYKPFTNCILTSKYDHPSLGKKNIKYSGYHELAYLHPKRFIPNPDVLKQLKIAKDERFFILRFVGWNATHDINHKGLSEQNKLLIVSELEKLGKVFISSEIELPEPLIKYKFPLHPGKMHDAIAFSSLVFGESATMITEGAVLGVPGVYLDDTGRFYTKDIETRYNLIYCYTETHKDQVKAIEKAVELAKETRKSYRKNYDALISDKIDVSSFLVWFVSNWPNSFKIMKAEPDFDLRFK